MFFSILEGFLISFSADTDFNDDDIIKLRRLFEYSDDVNSGTDNILEPILDSHFLYKKRENREKIIDFFTKYNIGKGTPITITFTYQNKKYKTDEFGDMLAYRQFAKWAQDNKLPVKPNHSITIKVFNGKLFENKWFISSLEVYSRISLLNIFYDKDNKAMLWQLPYDEE